MAGTFQLQRVEIPARRILAGNAGKASQVNPQSITVVTGMPRSGTSMMMQILEAGGMALVTDGLRKPDPQNPNGYFEWEPIKSIGHRAGLFHFEDLQGKVLKMVYRLVYHLPKAPFGFNLVVMNRDFKEIFESQQQLLKFLGKPCEGSFEDWQAIFAEEWRRFQNWLEHQPRIRYLNANYNDILANPCACTRRIADFLGGDLAIEPMVACVDGALYRQRMAR